jgi:integrase
MKYNVKIAPERRKDKIGQIITKNVPLFADIRFSGTRIFYFTGYRIDIDKFNHESQEVKKNSIGLEGKRDVPYNDINRRLKAIKATLEIFFQNTDRATREQIIKILDNVCKNAFPIKTDTDNTGFFTLFEKYLNVFKFSYERKRQVKSIINHWQRYAASRRIKITFESLTVDLLRDFERYLKDESTKPKARNSEVMVISHKGRNTIHKIMAMTRAFWNFAKNELKQQEIEISNPFGQDGYKIPGEVYGDPIYITKEERNILFNASLTSERLQRVRDLFVFQCLIGARVGDLCKLTKSNVQEGILTYIPRKTKDGKPVAVTIPLSSNAKEIVNRYDLPDGRLLPFITDQRYNDYLKELFKEVGITRKVTRLNPTTGEPEQVRLCDIASSHMARRAFIGNLYGKVDSGIISSMSGHIQGSKAFTRYYDVSIELQQKAIDLID